MIFVLNTFGALGTKFVNSSDFSAFDAEKLYRELEFSL